jgi:electron transfer flavoprotein beta subunit
VLRILVFVKEVPDVRIPVEYHEVTGRLRREWTVSMVNPSDRTALEKALAIKKDSPESHVTAIHLGPISGDGIIRECLALGCDEGLRVWDQGCPEALLTVELDEIQSWTKALIFSRVSRILGFDLILTGTKSQDTGSGQTGLLLASRLGIPCVTSAKGLKIKAGEMVAEITKMLSQGYRALIETPIPAVISMEALSESRVEPSLAGLLGGVSTEIPVWSLADLGISRQLIERMEGKVSAGSLTFPKSKLKYVEAPDPTLPAFLRIKKLVEGTVTTREGRLVSGPDDEVVEELFNTLLRDGWLDHLKNNT